MTHSPVFDKALYDNMLEEIFRRFPSVQSSGFAKAYKPGLERMREFDRLLGCPHRRYASIHIAGTNGKGSVANLLASALSACGWKVGLYTSPHLLDFRERIRVVPPMADGTGDAAGSPVGRTGKPEMTGSPDSAENGAERTGDRKERAGSPAVGTGRPDGTAPFGDVAGNPRPIAALIPEEAVFDFFLAHREDFERLDLSFFEITTALAFHWFAVAGVDVAVVEAGLGGRLDSTNILTPLLSIVTSIGLDHCRQLGSTLAQIAGEKAGIFKPGTPALVGEILPETEEVFRKRAAQTGSPLYFAERFPSAGTQLRKPLPLWQDFDRLRSRMDLQGEYQRANLRTALAALDILRSGAPARLWDERTGTAIARTDSPTRLWDGVAAAIVQTARRMDFHGRWEKLSDRPIVICDIAHNAHALKHNFAQLAAMRSGGKWTRLILVFGIMADKDLSAILPLLPREALYIFTAPRTERAMEAAALAETFRKYRQSHGGDSGRLFVVPDVAAAVSQALALAEKDTDHTLVYIGGSSFVVSEALPAFLARTT